MINKYQKTKSADNYTEEEILQMCKEASKYKYNYDYLIDKLYLCDKNKRNTCNSYEYSFLNARQLRDREYRENFKNLNFD